MKSVVFEPACSYCGDVVLNPKVDIWSPPHSLHCSLMLNQLAQLLEAQVVLSAEGGQQISLFL